MDPEGRSRTGIPAVDSCVLYRLSYLGVVSEMLRVVSVRRKMAEGDAAPRSRRAYAEGVSDTAGVRHQCGALCSVRE
jgi:hypothetical protein